MTVATWLALAVVVLGLVLLVWVLGSLAGRMKRLNAASIGLQTRAEQAMLLEAQLTDLEPRILEMSMRLERITGRFGRR